MRRTVALRTALVAAVAAVLGSGVILATGGQSPVTAISDPEAAPITQQWRLDGTYLVDVRVHGIDGTEGELLSAASGICRGISEGRTYDEAVSRVEDVLDIPAPDAEYVVAAAVRARCPEHRDLTLGLPPGRALVGP